MLTEMSQISAGATPHFENHGVVDGTGEHVDG